VDDGRRETPDWVICLPCRTIYAPALIGADRCPRCGDDRWEPSAIPDADERPTSPLVSLDLAPAV
jgi:hypothetical protein